MKFSTDLSDAISSGFSLEDPSDKCASHVHCVKKLVYFGLIMLMYGLASNKGHI